MPDLLIRNVPAGIAAALRARAKRNGRSLQAEALAALEHRVAPSGAAFYEKVREFHAGQTPAFDATAALEALRDDRSR